MPIPNTVLYAYFKKFKRVDLMFNAHIKRGKRGKEETSRVNGYVQSIIYGDGFMGVYLSSNSLKHIHYFFSFAYFFIRTHYKIYMFLQRLLLPSSWTFSLFSQKYFHFVQYFFTELQ